MSEVPIPPGLTGQMIAYAQGVANGFSYHDAYRAAYRVSGTYNLAPDIWRLNRNPMIAQYVRALQAAAAGKLQVTREWLLEWWFKRMIYDPTEITAWAVGCCHYCHGDGHNYQWREGEYFEAISEAEITKAPLPDCSGGFGFNSRVPPHPECERCDGRGVGRSNFTDTSELSEAARAGFEGVEETRNGIKIKMADKHAAAEQFAKLSGWDVLQVRHLTTPIPSDEALDKIANDPIALALEYKRLMQPGAATRH